MTEIWAQALFQCDCVVGLSILAEYFSMTKPVKPRPKAQRRRLYVAEWRKFRGLTQEQLAERVGMSVSNISQLERGLQGYSQEGLESLADALNCDPGHLLMVDPSKDEALWSLWEKAEEGQKREIVGFAKGVVRRAG
jgi:DNA-binding Xre family transcriptional regulator